MTAPCDHLSEKPGLYLDEMAVFMWDELRNHDYDLQHHKSPYSDRLVKKVAWQRAEEQNADLIDYLLPPFFAECQSYHLVC